jgi:hypothetical protein
MQLMQQYVKKSSTTIFPLKSLLKDSGLDTLNHSKSANVLTDVTQVYNSTLPTSIVHVLIFLICVLVGLP